MLPLTCLHDHLHSLVLFVHPTQNLPFDACRDLPVPAGSSRKQGCSACLPPPRPALRALRHLSLTSSDGLPPPADQRRLLRQLAGLPSLAVLDLGEHELDAYGAALQQQLPALQLNCYQLGCD
jgi:hypothetical protein